MRTLISRYLATVGGKDCVCDGERRSSAKMRHNRKPPRIWLAVCIAGSLFATVLLLWVSWQRLRSSKGGEGDLASRITGPQGLLDRSVALGVHARSEAAYHKSQNASLAWLEFDTNSWENANAWLLMGPFHNCQNRQRVGTPVDGGKWLCDTPLAISKAVTTQGSNTPCHVYSLGSAGSVSFEEAIHEIDPRCEVHTFDHTLNEDEANQVRSSPGVTFHPKGIASNAQLKEKGSNFTSVSKSMEDLGIKWLDILKIDIEGSEWEVFLEMLESGYTMPFTQILIEIHTMMGLPPGQSQGEVLKRFFTGMYKAGFRVFAVEYNVWVTTPPNSCWEYAFVKVDWDGYPIRPAPYMII